LEESPIKPDDLPDRAFDSAEEKQRVAALFEKYNHPPESPESLFAEPEAKEAPTPSEDELNPEPSPQTEVEPLPEGQPAPQGQEAEEPDETDPGDEADSGDESAAPDQALGQPVEMTPEIDAGFAEIAKERIARHPIRYYFLLPARRGVSIWFDTHSQYYPFEGELLPFGNLDYEVHQQFWLPLFMALTLLYTLLGIAGGWLLWQRCELEVRQWVLLAGLMIFLRIGFFATLENPEPRYVVEVFPFLSILGGIALTRILSRFNNRLLIRGQ
jgi:hypothetical protein